MTRLAIAPTGEANHIELKSTWPHPNFVQLAQEGRGRGGVRVGRLGDLAEGARARTEGFRDLSLTIEPMLERIAAKGVDVSAERREWTALRSQFIPGAAQDQEALDAADEPLDEGKDLIGRHDPGVLGDTLEAIARDKAGIVGFAQGLAALGFELLSTGGTGRALAAAGRRLKYLSAVAAQDRAVGMDVSTSPLMVKFLPPRQVACVA